MSGSLSALEVEDLVTVRDVATVLQRAEMVRRVSEEIEGYVVELGADGRLVMLQLDEFPLASIVATDGTINSDLFPNFARLAEEGTWYRNTLSDSIATTQSVPAILTGSASGSSTIRSDCRAVMPTPLAASISAGSMPLRPVMPLRSTGSIE